MFRRYLLTFWAASALLPSQTAPPQDWLSAARQARAAGDYQGAAVAYRELLKASPSNPQLLSNLGIMLHMAGEYSQALDALKRALSVQPASVPANLFAGLSLLGLERPAEAVPYLERARKGNPGGPLPVIGLAKAHLALGDARRANELFETAVWRDPANPEVWTGLGITYTATANAAAKQFWERTKETAEINAALKSAGFPTTRKELLAAEAAARRPGAPAAELIRVSRSAQALAVASFERAVKADPHSFNNRVLLAGALKGAHRLDEAAAQYEDALRMRADSAQVLADLGIVYWLDANEEKALSALTKALELDPDNAEANAIVGDVLAKAGEFDRARDHLERALRRRPELGPAHAALGKIHSAQGRFEQAIEEFRRALPSDWDGSYYYQLGQVLRQIGREEESREALEQFRARRAMRRSAP